MLNPSTERLDYGCILSAPPGCRLDFAVGTTYSLDLDALVGASLALALSEETDSALLNNPVCLLESLRTVGDRVALFCEDGQITLPGKITPLYILLENMVYPVRTKKRRGRVGYPSFHPKLWLLRYQKDEGGFSYRVAVLSRNLTFDRSWDISFYMDGKRAEVSTEKNRPLCDFLRYLAKQLPDTPRGKAKERQVASLIKELSFVEFSTGEKVFHDFEFFPSGIPGHSIQTAPLLTETFHELLIMSPFLSGSIIKDFNIRNDFSPIRNPRYALFTRSASLAKLEPSECSKFKIYTMRDAVIDGETGLSGEAGAAQKQDIHAKLYLMNKYSDTDLYLGSLNASHSAVYSNVEFVIRLKTKRRYLDLDKLIASLRGTEPGGSGDPFQEVTLDSMTAVKDEAPDRLDIVVKELVRCGLSAAVFSRENRFTLHLTFGSLPDSSYAVTVKPLLAEQVQPLAGEMIFTGLTLTQLSEFFVVSVSDGNNAIRRVILIPVEGIPEERDRAVVSGVVKDVGFTRYIAFLLGDDAILSTLETAAGSGGGAELRRPESVPALYEKMLQAAASDRQKLRRVEDLVKTVSGEGIIPEEFTKLYTTFKKAVKLDG